MKRIPTVGVIIIHEESVLLVEHGNSAGHITGSLGTPGGRLDEGENVMDGAVREVKEETGLSVDKQDLIQIPHIYEADIPRKNGETLCVSHTVFTTNKFTGELQDTDETKPVWIGVDKLKDYTLLINTEDMVKRAMEVLNEA